MPADLPNALRNLQDDEFDQLFSAVIAEQRRRGKKPMSDAAGREVANAKLSRDLGNGFRSQGSFTSANIEKVVLLKDNIEIVARATGTLRVVYTP